MKSLKTSIYLLSIALIFIFQFSFLSRFQILQPINLPLVLFIFSLLIFGENQALCLLASFGWLMEIYSHQTFGVIIFSLLVTFWLVKFLFNKFFTNNSLSTFLSLGTISVITFNFIQALFNFKAYYNLAYLSLFIQQLIWQLILIFLIFALTNYFSNRLKSNFLIK
jgi:hypothetical protein